MLSADVTLGAFCPAVQGSDDDLAISVAESEETQALLTSTSQASSASSTDGTIAGNVWGDIDVDGVHDAGEPPLANWTIFIDLNENTRFDVGEPSDTTDAQGAYVLSGLAAGTYTIAAQLEPGWKQTYPGLNAIEIERASVSSTGEQADGSSFGASLSDNGRYVAFASFAPSLVAEDTNGQLNVFVRDRETGSTERISVGAAGEPADDYSQGAKITPDGRYVAFHSKATNLIADDGNTQQDVFVHDRDTGITERVSQRADGDGTDGSSSIGSITPDGRYVTFQSAATNLVAGDTNGRDDVFVYDRQNGTVERVSLRSDGGEGNSSSISPSISADGRFVTFISSAANLVPGDTNGVYDVFVYDRQADSIQRISMGYDGSETDGHSYSSSISADGSTVVFESDASNLIEFDTNESKDVFVYSRNTGEIERVSVSHSGRQADGGDSWAPQISADGRVVVYRSDAGNLVPGDTNNNIDIFAIDRQTYTVRRLNVPPDGTESRSYALGAAISPGGERAAYQTSEDTLVSGDTNNRSDIFVSTTSLSRTHSLTLADGQQAENIDFGNREMSGRIAGVTWKDLDGDRIRDTSEAGLADWTVFLDDNQNRQLDAGETSTVTDSAGNYSFTGLSDGPYTVAELIPPGWGQTSPGDVEFDPLFQASIRDASLDGTGDRFNDVSPWLLSQTSSAENRVIQEFDLSGFTGQRLASASLDFELFINNSGGQSTRPFSFYLYAADGTAALSDFSMPAVYADSVAIETTNSLRAYHLDITTALQSVLDQGATFVGVRIDPADDNIYATGIRNLQLTAAAPLVGAAHEFFLTPGQIRDNVDFGNLDVAPYVASITRDNTTPTTASGVDFTVTFSETVTGVDVSDFATTAVGPTGTSITSVTGSGDTYTVTVSTGSGDGTIRLDVSDDDTILDVNSNPLEGIGAGNGDYTAGPEYVIDRELPSVTDMVRVDPSPTNAATVQFEVTFSEPVSGVDVSDVSIVAPELSGTNVQYVVGGPLIYTVAVATGSGDGALRLDVLANGTIVDRAGRALATEFSSGPEYQIDHVAPEVLSILRLDPNPTTQSSIRYGVTFSESVTGVNTTDFLIDSVGPSGASVTGVTGSDASYTVTVDTGTGDGRLRLDVQNDNSIRDAAGNFMAAGFTSGQVYVIDRAAPTVVSIVRAGANPTSADVLNYTVTFSEPVSGLDRNDFALNVEGLTGATVSDVTGSDVVHTATVETGTGDGSLRLDLVDDDSVVDDAGTSLGSSGTGNGDFTGEVYSVIQTPGIYGTKWSDIDGDGVWDDGEPGLAGVTIYLDLNKNGSFDTSEPTTTTQQDDLATVDVDETGRYAFTNLDAAIYTVHEVVPEYHAQTYPEVIGGTGRLAFVGAVIDGQDGVDGLRNAQSVAVSPDGKHVYAAAFSDDAVTAFRRDPVQGTLSLVQQVTSSSGALLNGAYSVTVTPDGSQVLAVSRYDDALIIFDRDSDTGELTHRQSIQDTFTAPDGLNGAHFVAISPDGDHAYVAGYNDSAMGVFARNESTNIWSYVERHKDNTDGVDGLSGVTAVAVSPDGQHVYATADYEDAVSIFSRDSTSGALTYQGLVRDNLNGVDGLNGAVSVIVSPDGENVYVTGQYDNAISVFQRDPATGALAFLHRLRDEVDGVDGLYRAFSVIVSGDGNHVYAAGANEHEISLFRRDDADGSLTFVATIGEYDSGVDGMTTPRSIALSPDENHVYVAAYSSSAIAAFARDGGQPSRMHRVAYSSGQTVLSRDFGNRRLPLEVVASQPTDEALLNAVPTTMRVDFNFDVDQTTLDVSDLTVNSTPATGFTLIDGSTVDFHLPTLSEGTHTAAMAADSVLPRQGDLGLLVFQSQFTVDLTTPQVTVESQVTTDADPSLSGTVDDATANVSVTVENKKYSATNHGDGTWSIADDQIDLLPYGIHDVQATATDPAGNAQTDATTGELEIVRSLVTVSGPASIAEGTEYVATLSHHTSLETITSWTIDWGDGSTESFAGDPSTVSHTYTDGTLGYPIRATAHGESGAAYTNDVAVGPDPTFGDAGYVSAPFGAFSSSSKLDIAVGPDGTTVSIGEDGSNHWVVARHLADGSPDSSFGSGGSVVTEFAGHESSGNRPRGVAPQDDGKIVVAGNASSNHWAIARYHGDGSLDLGFGNNGVQIVDRGVQSRINAILVDDAGRIVIGGTEWIAGRSDVVVARLNPDGSFDSAFGNAGVVTTNRSGSGFSGAEDLAVDAQGRIVAAGYSSGTSAYAMAVRYRPDGSLDTSFNRDGIFWQSFSGFSAYARSIAIDADNRIVLAADLLGDFGDDDWGLIRLNRYGMLDSTFGGNGRVSVDLSNTDDQVHDVLLQRDGRIFVAGSSFVSGEGDNLALARVQSDGSVDPTFAGGGTWVAPPRSSTWEAVLGVSLSPNDQVVAVTGYQEQMEIARFEVNSGSIAQVNNVAPELSATGADSIEEGLDYTLNLTSFDPGDDAIEYWTIDWGDGDREFHVGSASSATHVYARGGNSYPITVTATDDDGEYSVDAPTVAVTQVPRGSITGVKWNDRDGDGIRDADERGLGGVTIFVDFNDNVRWDTGEPAATTAYDDPDTAEDEAGYYRIDDVVQGTHPVVAVLPEGRAQTVPGPLASPLQRISSPITGGEANADSGPPQISDDGRYIAFRSSASNLVSGDTNGVMDLFVYDRKLGTMERASLTETGQQSTWEVLSWSLSGDGRTVAYDRWKYLQTGRMTVRDLDTGQYDWDVSGSYDGPSLSADGRFMAYEYYSSDPLDAAVYWRDLQSPSVTAAGSGNRNSGQASISDNGNFVAYTTHASDIVADDTNQRGDVILYRRSDNSKTRISVSSAGTQGNGDSYQPDVSRNGPYVAFTSEADNLVAGDTNGVADIFVHDPGTGMTERISVASDGLQSNGPSLGASISADGRYVLFSSRASNLVAGDTNGTSDLFVHDRVLDTTERVSVTHDGGEANGASSLYSTQPALSADGRYVSFASGASNLVAGDTNGYTDAFVTPTTLGRRTGTHMIEVVSGETTSDIDFASQGPVGEISGQLWHDVNNDGVRNTSEPALADRTVYLDLNHNDRLDSGEPAATTDDAGSYSFNGLLSGTYDVLTVPVAGWKQTSPAPIDGDTTYIGDDAQDHVYDSPRGLLYLTGDGEVKRYDLQTETFLTPWVIGDALIRGADITPDGRFLYVAGGTTDPAFHKIEIETGAISAIPYTPGSDETGPWDVAITSNGDAFLSTRGSGSVPLRRLDLSDDSISVAKTTYDDRNLWTSFDDTKMVLASDILASNIYDAQSDSFTSRSTVINDNPVAISRNNSLIAAATYSTLYVYDSTLQNIVFSTGDYDLNGGVVFDPVRDLMYVGNTETNRVVAYDQNTWTPQFEFTGFLHGVQRYQGFSEGLITISPDGRRLFVSTGSAIQAVRLTPRHRVELTSDESVSGIDFGQSLKSFQAIEADPADESITNVPPSQVHIVLNDAVDPATVQAGDLLIDGAAATGVTSVDSHNILFDLPALADGAHVAELQSGALLSSATGMPVAGEQIEFEIDTVAPIVDTAAIGDTSGARSMIQQLVVTFDDQVTVADGAFTLQKRGPSGGTVDLEVAVSASTGQTIATLSFAGEHVEQSGSLSDGNYELQIDASKIFDTAGNPLDGDGDGTAGDDFTIGDTAADTFFRLYGDADGDRGVDFVDYYYFGNAFRTQAGDAEYNSQLDWDDDGGIDFVDYYHFGNRFRTRMDFE